MRIPFWAWLFQGIPESIASVAFVMSVSTGKFQWKTIIGLGLLQSVLAYLVRMLAVTPGVHLVILLLTLALLTTTIGRVDNLEAIFYSLACYMCICLYEVVSFYFLLDFLGLDYEYLKASASLRIITGLPVPLLLFLVANMARNKLDNLNKWIFGIRKG